MRHCVTRRQPFGFMNKTERIEAALKGEAVDRVPFGFWTHLPKLDLDPVLLADRTYEFYREFDLDFIKTMNNGMYPVEDYGCEIDYSAVDQGGVAKLVRPLVTEPEGWNAVPTLDVQGGALGRELYGLELLLKKVGRKAPVVMTVFSPLTIAAKLSANHVIQHIREGKAEHVRRALEAIAETTAEFIARVIDLGASGVFFASQMCQRGVMSEAEYLEFGVPYDLEALKPAAGGWFNIFHLHGNEVMFSLMKDYPLECVNWHVWETTPDFTEARDQSDKCFMGGIVRTHITEGDYHGIESDVKRSWDQLKGIKHIVTPGCGIRHPVDASTLQYTAALIRDRLKTEYRA